MIKVQPAHSRLVKSETRDELTITCPPPGIFSIGGVLILIGVAGLVLVVLLLPAAFRARESGFVIGAFVGLLPGIAFVLGGLAEARYSWRVSRSADWVTFTRPGLWGRQSYRWPTQEVTT